MVAYCLIVMGTQWSQGGCLVKGVRGSQNDSSKFLVMLYPLWMRLLVGCLGVLLEVVSLYKLINQSHYLNHRYFGCFCQGIWRKFF